ncbi:MAG: adenylyl-sulfate kinase [Clostridium sp.]
MDNIFEYDFNIKRFNREKLIKQKGRVIWITGLSGSGKSTIANLLEENLYNRGYLTYILDGDNIRKTLNSDLGFENNDRAENIRRVGEVLEILLNIGVIVIATFVSPLEEDREKLKTRFGDRFIETYIRCSVKDCETRDPKGIYKRVREGLIKNFTGVDSPYQVPKSPNIVVDTVNLSPVESVEIILDYLKRVGDINDY